MAQRTGEMLIQGVVCQYDTLVHRTIAPGAKLTQFQFQKMRIGGTNYKMKVHLITIDQRNKYNSFTPYLAKGEHHKVNTQKQEVQRQKNLGLKPIATLTGGGFVQSNGASATATAYEVTGSFVTQGEVKYESLGVMHNLYVSSDKTVNVGGVQMNAFVTANGKTKKIGQINHHRDKSGGSANLSLFCNGITRSLASKPDEGVDVRLKVEGGKVLSGKDTRCTVVEVVAGANHTINKDEAILSGTGEGEDFLRGLKEGDEISVTVNYINEAKETIDVQDMVSRFQAYCIRDGKVQAYETKNYAICAIGCSEDGATAYWADLEISPNSNAPCICLADLLKAVGVYNAIWLDGGPSAEMTVDGEFVSTNSIGYGFNGRYIPAGLMLYSVAPDDKVLDHVEATDPSPRKMAIGDRMLLDIYGYNQYDEMIMPMAQNSGDVEFSCTNSLGEFDNGYFVAQKGGEGKIIIKVKSSGNVIEIPVTIEDKRVLSVWPKRVFTGEERACQLKLRLTENGMTKDVDPKDAVWSTVSSWVVKSCKDGCLVPYVDGEASVYVTYDGLRDTVNVTVENLESADIKTIYLTDKVKDKTDINVQLPSVPRSFVAEVRGEPESIVTLYYTTGYTTTKSVTDTIQADGTVTMTVDLDYDAVDTYPVVVNNIVDSRSEMAGDLCVTELVANYDDEFISGVVVVEASPENQDCYVYNLTGQRVVRATKGIYIEKGKKTLVR